MDGYNLRCNNLRCRRLLDARAVVTTCSHVFCEPCADTLNLTNPPLGRPRQCPACGAMLSAPDDAVISLLNPSEDYKTSLLSGLCPSVILEICSRGMAFWNYQVTQEVVYQETLARGLTEKYGVLSNQLDKFISDANAEIARLHDKVAALTSSEEDLKKKNHELMEAWREKGRKLAQTQELYDKLKRRTLMSQVGQGAVDNLERALGYNGQQQQSAIHDLTGPDPVIHQMQQNQQPSMRRHKNIVEPDFVMTGARIGTANGSGDLRQGSGGGSSGGRRSPVPRFNQEPGMYRPSSQNNTHFENMAMPSSGQEHRQRLPPTPANSTRTGTFGQNSIGVGVGAPMNRNPLGSVNNNSGRVNGGGGGFVFAKR